MNLGIYIQVPFCQTKCTYCNFHTGAFPKGLYSPYVTAVCKEIASREPARDASVDTVYIGGGTPSLLAPAALARVMESVRANFRCDLHEVTLEADPETITLEKARSWHSAGIDRISMGVQSFDDMELQAAGRLHRSADVANAEQWLRQAGIRNISMDLIAGLPHQTAASWASSLEHLIRLHPEHISIYMMEIDEGSRLGREVLSGGARYSARELPSDDAMADFYELACERLAAEGYEHYEISNWALPGFCSRHNLKYWRREPYLGFGAGAHSFGGNRRWSNRHDPAAYVDAIEHDRSPVDQEESVTVRQALEEELFLGLRQLAGIDLHAIEHRYHVGLADSVSKLEQQGLIERDGDRIRLAPSRLTVSNEVFVELLGQ
jgi:oxygen-independent coproporphyrinogen III oxidase